MTGVAGFVAARHLKAIADTGNRLVAAVDPHDAVGVLDRYAFDVRFFTEFERFDRHLEKLRRGPEAERVHYLSVCSPNYLHDAHMRLALRVGADAICEKPLVINPWNLDGLQELEQETGRRIYTVLQLRLHPALVAFREQLKTAAGQASPCAARLPDRARPLVRRVVEGRRRTLRRHRHQHRHSFLRPAGVAVRRRCRRTEVHLREAKRAAGTMTLDNADVQWYLSAEAADLPFTPEPGARRPSASITVDGEQLEFSEGFTDLHTRVYRGGAGRPRLRHRRRAAVDRAVASHSPRRRSPAPRQRRTCCARA